MRPARPSLLPVLLVVAALPACRAPDQPQFTISRRPIINGEIDNIHPSVVALVAYGEQFCTGTVIAPRAVLTAGHCVEESGIPATQMKIFFGTTVGGGGITVNVVDAHVNPNFYIRGDGAPMNDVAVLTLAADAPQPPMAWQRTPLENIAGRTVTLVGYGVTNAAQQTGNGTRRMVDETVENQDATFVYYGGGVSGTCQGDSGGPMFLNRGGVPTLVSVTSFGDQSCVQLGANTRVDIFASFIQPYAIVPVTVAFTDPNEADMVGSAFTVTVDATSPAGVTQVDLYVDGNLQASLAAPPWTFAVQDLGDGTHELRAHASGADGGNGEATLHVTVATAIVGAPCAANVECQSGICADAATGQGYCTQPCEATSDCPNEAACEEGYCGAPGSAKTGGGCRASDHAGGDGAGLFALALLALLAVTHRGSLARRRPRS